MNSASSNIPALPTTIPSYKSKFVQPKASYSTRTSGSTQQQVVKLQTSKSTTTLPRRTAATHKPSISTTRVQATPQVGDRIILENGTTGTLRYLGETSFKKGSWAGIELDELGTGKNSGIVNGTKYFQCLPNTGLFVLAQKVQLLERKKLSPSNEGKSSSSPIGRKSTLQHKLGNGPKEYDQDNIPRVDVEELQVALQKAIRENASLKDNQDQVVRLEKLLTVEKHLNEKLHDELEHSKRLHASQLKSCREESSHLGATIDELEAVNKVLNSTLQELTAQPLDHHHSGVDSMEFHRLTQQMTDLQAKHHTICEQLEAEKEQHCTTQRQLDQANIATQKLQQELKDHQSDIVLAQTKLIDAIKETYKLSLQKQDLQQELDILKSRELEHDSLGRANVMQLNNRLSELQTENEDLKFALQELTIALEKAKENAETVGKDGPSETQQESVIQLKKAQSDLAALTEKYDTTAQALENEKYQNARMKEHLSELQSSVTSSQQHELANINYKESLAVSAQRIDALEDEIAQLYTSKSDLLQKSEKHSAMQKDIEEKQRIIDQLLGDISELQSLLTESRDQMDERIEELELLRQTRDGQHTEYQRLQESYKQLEMECLKLMDEIIVNANDSDDTNAASSPSTSAPESFSYALQISHRRMKELEVKFSKMQGEMTSKMHTATQQHLKVINTKEVTIEKLSKELSDFEYLVENKIFRESELEELLAKEQDRRRRLEQEILDMQAQTNVPISSHYGNGPSNTNHQTKASMKNDSTHYIAYGKENSTSESYCGICDHFGHDTIDCKKLDTKDMLNTFTSQDNSQPHCDYCEMTADIPHWTDDCPYQQESY